MLRIDLTDVRILLAPSRSDWHVIQFATYFSPIDDDKLNLTFVRILCQESADWIKWNFN
jgi:hypothetical protein